jgi:1-acyl-sn-glycerol-3-phosphate acyltransferase
MVVASVLAIGVLSAGFSIPDLFLLVAILNGVVAIYIYTLAPEFILRFCTWVLVHIFYRIRVHGAENIPAQGPVLLACNHVSYVDALVIGGCIKRPVRFVMYYKIFNIPVIRGLFRVAGVIPIAGAKEDPQILEQAFEAIDAALARDEVVCIFPEGHLTRSGEVNVFRPGIDTILQRRSVPTVPMALTGLWGTFFSRAGKGAMRRLPKPLWFRVDLKIGSVMDAGIVSAVKLQEKVSQLTLNE